MYDQTATNTQADDECCPAGECDYEPTDGLLDRNGYETRKCCNCGDVADFFVRTYDDDCDGPSLLLNGRGGFSPESQP